MKREILFRGKRIDNGEWIEGSLINNAFFKNASSMPIFYIFNANNDVQFDCFEDTSEDQNVFSVASETVGQFTGLTDKNGVKIFEGDELKVNTSVDNSDEPFDLDPEMIEQEITVSVVWNDNVGGFDLITIESDLHLTGWGFGYGEDAQEFEVIGNIHKTK